MTDPVDLTAAMKRATETVERWPTWMQTHPKGEAPLTTETMCYCRRDSHAAGSIEKCRSAKPWSTLKRERDALLAAAEALPHRCDECFEDHHYGDARHDQRHSIEADCGACQLCAAIAAAGGQR